MPQPDSQTVHFDQLLTRSPDRERVAKRIVKEGSQYCVKSDSGKSLGCYPTREEAEKRLGQVEFFKQFDIAHAALHSAFDHHAYSDDLALATGRDVRKVSEAHDRLVAKALELNILHEHDPNSPLDVVTLYSEAEADPTPENMRKAAVRTNEELRYSLAPLYVPGDTGFLDAHKEWATASDLQKAVWDLSLSGDNDVRLQHHPDILAGKRVELVSWPYSVSAEFIVPDGAVRKAKRVELPAGTVYQGTIWEGWSWPLVKSGRLLGLSMGGWAKRRTGAPPHVLADFGPDAHEVAKAAGAPVVEIEADVELDPDVEAILAECEDDETGGGFFGKAKKPKTKTAKRRKVHTVMSEFKEGKLTSGTGGKVTSRDQAIAIALSEAGLSRKRKKTKKAWFSKHLGSRHDQQSHGGRGGGGGREDIRPYSRGEHGEVYDPTGEQYTESNRTKSGHRPLETIAREIANDWGSKVNFAARPYLDAMRDLSDITDHYGADSARSIVAYFLSNSAGWRGDTAKRIKAELRALNK